MPARNRPLPGLHVYRAVAVILMILAHAARTQANMPTLHAHPASAGISDWPFVGALIIEPIISALFLFIAGFSLVLSRSHSAESGAQWLQRLGRRMGTLYAISVLFALAEQGVQWPGMLVSSGVLGIIAVGVFSAGCMLVSRRPWLWLGLAFLLVTAISGYLDSNRISIIGLNAGAGGMLPLVSLAWLGTLTGLIYRHSALNGLGLLLGGSTVVAILALLDHSPWITHPANLVWHYPGDRLHGLLHSLQDALGLYEGQAQAVQVRYWNHGWLFAMRVLPLLVLGLMVFLATLPVIHHPVLRFLEWMGKKALDLYILHLVLLALVMELAGFHPASGWQTLLLVLAILALAPFLLRRISFVPLRIGKPPAP